MGLLTLNSFGLLGFFDDYRKIKLGSARGLSASKKILIEIGLGLLIVSVLYMTRTSPVETVLIIPFFKQLMIQLGGWYILFSLLVVVGTSNAVNLTDGLDGLAILPVAMVAAALGVFAYLAGHAVFAHYLVIPYVAGVGEVGVLCAAIVGAGLGFLWFNAYPAQVFMGDVGSLGIGAVLGVIAVMVRQEFALMIMGGIFVMETLSVILQVLSFKLTGNRIFRMAPLHHHYELKGWPEPKVIVRFWIITLLLVLLSLATLKLR